MDLSSLNLFVAPLNQDSGAYAGHRKVAWTLIPLIYIEDISIVGNFAVPNLE
ncbi:hypothetical protein PC116_g17823 [Phytophthora cactorum]|nr:hypothetical protein PC114_g15247 [Phytophthora cactorum]KAG3008913.1 hypothetical protein PC120_g15932 [Phytophthora cactorum]KAG3024327.1 hypothetical protein PC119_g8544 [Phytophthora cactorum]KAG3192742.1 hypothetical protein PC128_g10436 [Phytophthora cactorum]KAG4048357.1 hypothetical protein PC123_g16320 [Phytophthora cactorum]